MKSFKIIQFKVREDYGKEFYLSLFVGESYSLLQVEVDFGEYGKWVELPYLQISMGYGRLFSFLLTIGKIGLSFDILGRNWR